MKKAFLLASALLLLGGSVVFANGETKDKNKGRKPACTENTCCKPCPKPCPKPCLPPNCDKSKGVKG